MDIITKLAKMAALATVGVARLCSPIDVVVIPKSIDTFDVDIFLIIKNGYKIPDIAWDVQENVKKALDKHRNNKVEHINIHIEGIDFSED